MRRPALINAASESASIFATVSRLDGGFGLLGGDLADPLSGGLAGLTKSASHEWPAVQCRALDRAPDWMDVDEVAKALGLGAMLDFRKLEVALDPPRAVAPKGLLGPGEAFGIETREIIVDHCPYRLSIARIADARRSGLGPGKSLFQRL